MAVDDKVVIGLTHGLDDPESVLIAYLLGVEALRKDKQVVMWLTKDGVHVATPGFAARVEVPARLRCSSCTRSMSSAAAGSSRARSASRHATSKVPSSSKVRKSRAQPRSMSSPKAARSPSTIDHPG